MPFAIVAPSVPQTAALEVQPEKTFKFACGLAFFSVLLHKDMVIPQHVHEFDHATYIGSGSARLWEDGAWVGDCVAGDALTLKAGVEHIFQALEEGTRITCVWPEAMAEHFDVDIGSTQEKESGG